MANIVTPSDVAVVGTANDERSYVDWPAIFAGTVLAAAISATLLVFGSALGLSIADFDESDGISAVGLGIAAALWLVWVQVSAYFAGGYLTGRLRRRHHDATESESDIRDGSHGLVMWALGVVFSGMIAVTGLGAGAATTAISASTVAAGAASNPEADDAYSVVVDRFLRGTATGQAAIGQEGRAEIGRIITSSLDDDALADADRAYLTSLIASSAGVDEAAAQQRVDALWTEAQAARADALEVADRARKVTLIGAFLTAASLFIAAAAAYYAATLGGRHRDQQTDVVGWYSAWR
ncbi:MAG TPA: hypothetical protein VMF90_21360 [Rhizobiaceae bacterium]|nr:hypothetical protein [Rhizobiaceae bacterium]